MHFLDSINSLISDEDLTFIILIITVLLGLIPLMTAIREEEKNTKKNKNKPIKKQLTKTGKWYLLIVLILLLVGYWKLQRDKKMAGVVIGFQKSIGDTVNKGNDTIQSLNNKLLSLQDYIGKAKVGLHKLEIAWINQFKNDTSVNNGNLRRYREILSKIKFSLSAQNIGIDKDYNVVKGSVFIGNTFTDVGVAIQNNYIKK